MSFYSSSKCKIIFACMATIMAVYGNLAFGQTELFSSEMTDSTGWGYAHFNGLTTPGPGDTVSATFDYDYSQFGIPESPNVGVGDAATQGLKVTINDTGQFAFDQLAVFYEDDSFTGQYTIQVDVWANWAAQGASGVGTTEHVGVFAGFDSSDVDVFDVPALNGAGVMYSTDGDCGNCDYLLLKDVAELDTFSGQFSDTDFGFGNQQGVDNSDVGVNLDMPTAFPSFDISAATNGQNGFGDQTLGAAGFQWVTITMEVDTEALGNGTLPDLGTTKVTLESARTNIPVVLGTVDNSVADDTEDGIITGEAPVGMDGGLALVAVDFFAGGPSPANLGFVVFDNVRVYDGFLTDGVSGDFDGDSDYDCDDIDALVGEIVAGTNNSDFDLTGDGVVDTADLAEWRAEAGAVNLASGEAYLEGDANLDGSVDVGDFNIWNGNKFTSVAAWCSGDFNAGRFRGRRRL